MKKFLKLISLLLVVTLTIGLLDTQYSLDNSKETKRNALAVDYENYVVNDMRDVHVYSQSQLEKFVDNVSYSEKSDKKIKAKAVKTIPLSAYKGDIVNIGLHFFHKDVRPYAASCSEA